MISIFLSNSNNQTSLIIDNKVVTNFQNQSIDDVVKWIETNIRNAKIIMLDIGGECNGKMD